MSDLAKRLINDAATLVRDWDITRELEREAADEIERLRQRIDVLHEHDGTCCPLCAMENKIERLRDQLSFMTRECQKFEAVVDAAKDYLLDHHNDSEQALFDALAALEEDE